MPRSWTEASPARRRVSALTIALALIATLTVLSSRPATADSVTAGSAKLPWRVEGTSAVWSGERVYVFGGQILSNGASNHIVEYDPATDEVRLLDTRLPTARAHTSAVWTGDAALVFGGTSGTGGTGGADVTEVVRFDPVQGTATVIASLPYGLDASSAVWTGEHVYLFGGRKRLQGSLSRSDEIIRFTPATNEVVVLSARLPESLIGSAAVWAGDHAYVFGGLRSNEATSDRIIQFSPITEAPVVLPARLPSGRTYAAAVWGGGTAFVFGGQGASGTSLDQVVQFRPGQLPKISDAYLPSGNYLGSAVWDGERAYLVGGAGLGDRIHRYDPRGPGVPRSVTAVAGPENGQVTVSWQPPSTGSTAHHYRVYRSLNPNEDGFYRDTTSVTFTDSELPWNTAAYYRVSAVDAEGVEGQLSKRIHATTFSEPASPWGLNRWYGMEGGSGCFGSSENACRFFNQNGEVYGVQSMARLEDPDGVTRSWPARTGGKLAVAAVLDSWTRSPFPAYLSTVTPFPSGTVSFAIRMHTLPLEPVVFYRHEGTAGTNPLLLTLSPTGHVLLGHVQGSPSLGGTTLKTQRWYVISLSYGQGTASVKLYIDGRLETTSPLPSAPNGHVSIGIVKPINSPFMLGLDDYVEAVRADAPILGALVNYLIPHGSGGESGWGREQLGDGDLQRCMDAAKNWQVVSEDILWTMQTGPSSSTTCDPSFFHLVSSQYGATDEYTTEGIPSIHVPTSTYTRDVLLQPRAGDAILGVRPVAAVKGPLKLSLSLIHAGREVSDTIEYPFLTSASEWWTISKPDGHAVRPDGKPWTIQTLSATRVKLQNLKAEGSEQRVRYVRIDYVWVPA